ncbi:MAG: hypothetical protein VXZ35_11305, partial [Pseudomonadota bacterium]|nr:hypothetical protein [Pseudomonadota bacterium]
MMSYTPDKPAYNSPARPVRTYTVIDIHRHLNNLSRLDFSDESLTPMQQLGAGLRGIFEDFPL